MQLDYLTLFILSLFGLGSGLFVGTAAGTAASFLIPALTLFAGYTTQQAIGTSLGVDCIIGIIAGLTFLKNKFVELRSSFLLVISGVIGALIGSQFTSRAPEGVLSIIIAGFLVFIGYNFVRRGVSRNVELVEKRIQFTFFRKHTFLSLILLGTIIGIISGFIGIGGSRMLTIILIFVLGFSLHQAIGTSLIMMIFIAGSGSLSHGFNSTIPFSGFLVVGLFAGIGAFIGSRTAGHINEDTLARVVGVIIMILAMVILLNALF